MATKIRRSLYIGLGGTGMKALLHTKKMFIDTYGEVPPMIGFLAIDTDGGEYKKTLKSVRNEEIKIVPNEQLELKAQGAVDFYNYNKPDFTWIPEININSIAMLRGDGAGGVRSNGRFAFTVNKESVLAAVRTKINNITSATINANDKYELLSNNLPEIHLVFSICGGTGCGTFLNMAYLLKQINSALQVTGYAVLPGAFEGIAATANAVPNTYGSLFDLDYFMHHGIGNTPIGIKYLSGEVYNATERPFKNVFFIDNTNANHDNYGNVEKVTEMISLALITAAGELSVANASVGDNFSVMIGMGTLDIENKKAWASGMGACEIVYRGKELAEIYRMKAAINIIDRLTNSTADANIIANSWIDDANVKIRENNGKDDLTDYLGDKAPRFPLTEINDTSKPEADIDSNKNVNKLDQEEIDKKVQAKLETVRAKLRDLIVENINGEGGIAIAKRILEELKEQLNICYREMNNESQELKEKIATLNMQIDNLIKALKAATGIWNRSKRTELIQQLCVRVREYNECVRDEQRHTGAITFYTTFLTEIDAMKKRIENLENLLASVKSSLSKKVIQLQNNAEKDGSIFQINLAEEDAKRVTINEGEIVISDMIAMLKGEHKLYNFVDNTTTEIEEMFMKYTATLTGAESYMTRGVEEVMKSIMNNDPAELTRIIAQASRKSQPLFAYNHRGRRPRQPMIDMIYVGVEDKESSILRKDDLFESTLSNADTSVTRNVAFASTGMKDKVIIYNQVGVVPIYALANIPEYEVQYRTTYLNDTAGHHFDDDMLSRAKNEGFEIQPRQAYDANNLMDLWVRGFVYGLIKNENGKYMMKSNSLGQALDNYWVSLKSAYRNEAYEEFKRQEAAVVKDFRPYIIAEDQRKGAEATISLIDDVKRNYLEGYSQLKLDRRTLDSHGYEKVKALIEQELRHVEQHL